MSLRAIRGTRDILPGEVEVWRRVEEAARRTFDLYGYGEIRTPIFEETAVFLKGTGADSEIVQKEMYRFTDLGDNDLTLRPEGTPPVVRAYLEHGLGQGKQIDRYYYIGPMFRYERPQKGRYRQFHQIGVEVFGSEAAGVDAEVIEMAMRWLRALEIRGPRLVLNSVGDQACRPAYTEAL
ncbi:MAG: ATP phosphoribosyltransferase regulatory subunit, partial [Acidobacteriota bacterium]